MKALENEFIINLK